MGVKIFNELPLDARMSGNVLDLKENYEQFLRVTYYLISSYFPRPVIVNYYYFLLSSFSVHFHFYRTNVNSSFQLLKFSSCVTIRYYLLLFIYAVSGLGPRANCKGSVCKVLGDTPTQYRKGYLKEFF